MSLDFNAFGSSPLGAFRDSGFNARKRGPDATGLVIPRDTFVGARVVWDACPGYSYLTRYSSSFAVACGTAVYSVGFQPNISMTAPEWSIVPGSGALPGGMSLGNPIGVAIDIVGAASAAGDYLFTIRAEDASSVVEGDFTLRVLPALNLGVVGNALILSAAQHTWIDAGTGYWSGDGKLLPCGSGDTGDSQFGISGVGYIYVACHDSNLANSLWVKFIGGASDQIAIQPASGVGSPVIYTKSHGAPTGVYALVGSHPLWPSLLTIT